MIAVAIGYPAVMTTGQIVAIIVLVLLVALVVAAVMIFRRRSPTQRRFEAAQHRREAEQRRASAERLEAEAAQRAERARAEQAQAAELAAMARHDREVAEKAHAEAMRLDPDHAGEPNAVEQRPARERSTEPAARHDDERRRQQAEYRPEPIVAGAAAGLLEKRRNRQHTDAPTGEPNVTALPTQRPAPAAESTKNHPTSENVDGRTPDTGHRDADTAPQGATATADEDRRHHPVRNLADRIMGRS